MGEHRYTYPVVVELRRMVAVTGIDVPADTGRYARASSLTRPDAAPPQSGPVRGELRRREAR